MCGRLQLKALLAAIAWTFLVYQRASVGASEHQWFESQMTTLCILGETAKT